MKILLRNAGKISFLEIENYSYLLICCSYSATVFLYENMLLSTFLLYGKKK